MTTNQGLPSQTGDCFPVAAKLVLADPDLTLVHGIVTGQGPIEGVRHWHAWVEKSESLSDPIAAWIPVRWSTDSRVWRPARRHVVETAIDKSNGKDLVLPVQLYYKLGQVTETWRYRFAEVVRLTEAMGHWGPWAEDEIDIGG